MKMSILRNTSKEVSMNALLLNYRQTIKKLTTIRQRNSFAERKIVSNSTKQGYNFKRLKKLDGILTLK